ncbi:MAG: hypothetical protein M2R45_02905 [Verrucomicrobia subdivision 3 bacterium]|nr:hypothetical protein [Limisphaerales bacterium]MCS1414757.1 hypothetical protein [Limisphaerales bacterium]
MKTLGVRTKFFALAIAVSLLTLGVATQAAPGTATVASVKGAVTGATVGDSLAAGSVVSTQSGGEAVLDIIGNTVVVTENSALAIDLLDVEETGIETVLKVQLNLTAGRIYGEVKQFSSSLSSFLIKIPKGQVAIDASEGLVIFDVSADGKVLVGEGSVDIVFDRGTIEPNIVAQNIQANQQFNPITGGIESIAPGAIPPIPPTLVTAVITPVPPERPFEFFISPVLGGSSSSGE